MNVTIAISYSLQLFENIPSTSATNPEPNSEVKPAITISIAEIAKKTKATEEFLFRLVRVLGAFEILTLAYPPSPTTENGISSIQISHTELSLFLLSPSAKASFRNHFEILLPAQLGSVPGYYEKHGFRSPVDSKNVPYTFAHGAVDMDFFDLLVKNEEKLKFFNEAMTIMAVLGLKPLGTLYPFDQLIPNSDGVALVDIGGGKGQMLAVIQDAYPSLKGKLVLQDLKVVLEGGTVVGEEVKRVPYDFFKEVQPIRGLLPLLSHGSPFNLTFQSRETDEMKERTTFSSLSSTTGRIVHVSRSYLM